MLATYLYHGVRARAVSHAVLSTAADIFVVTKNDTQRDTAGDWAVVRGWNDRMSRPAWTVIEEICARFVYF